VQNFTEIGSPILGVQIGEVLVFLLTNTHHKQTNKFFRLAYRSQIWTELNELMLITRGFRCRCAFWGLDDDQLFLGVCRRPKIEILGA